MLIIAFFWLNAEAYVEVSDLGTRTALEHQLTSSLKDTLK